MKMYNNMFEIKFKLNRLLRILMVLSVIYELFVSPSDTGVLIDTLNIAYWGFIILLLFTNYKIFSLIFITLFILKIYVFSPENLNYMIIDKAICLSNFVYLTIMTCFFSKIKYGLRSYI